MKDSVRNAFFDFSVRFEGSVPFLYLDILCLVTVGVGNLVDPVAAALDVPFVIGDRPATRDEVARDWHAVKDRPDLAKMGHRAFEKLTTIRLTEEGTRSLVNRKLAQFELQLIQRFPAFHEWCADAQLALLSMSWAAGPAFKAPRFEAHAKALNFDGCAEECRFQDEHNPGLRPRNDANQRMFRNAARVMRGSLNPSELYFPVSVLEPVTVEGNSSEIPNG